ncbi:MAG: pyridoxamine 5'-phosphate oxidase family protein [Tannerella sp.]|nr:pyridoxamine 5'-phosphate oxidase family protein [Tannerella sp.]
MKRVFIYFSVIMISFSAYAENAVKETIKEKEELTVKDVYEFVKKCGFYFIATADGDQPRVRPFGTVAIFENKLYIQTSKQKNIAKQLKANPKIEICAYDASAGKWVRIEAKAIPDERREAKKYMLDQYPELRSMYSEDDDKTLVLYLKDATAYFSSFSEEPQTVKF